MPRTLGLTLFAAATLAAAGCGGNAPPPAAGPPPNAAAGPTDDHTHAAGAHGGLIVEVGRHNYHTEVVLEKGGVLRLYTLGLDEAKVQEFDRQDLSAHVKAEGATESVPVTLSPDPQPGDGPGKTSQFVGRLPKELAGKPLKVTVGGLAVGGERYRISFTLAAGSHEEQMPPSVAGTDEERRLFLTPGGRYTAADVKANGGTTASEKYRGFQAAHETNTRPGDLLCPVTSTKANAKCTWVIDGKTYEFCCPPCIEEFVRLAKEQPDKLQEPESYRKPK